MGANVFTFLVEIADRYLSEKAFNKEIKLTKRLPFILLYVFLVGLVTAIFVFLGIFSLMEENVIVACLLFLGALGCVLIIIGSFVKR